MTESSSPYLHGFSPVEQARLIKQARLLESTLFNHVDYTGVRRLLEVGSGVGAQTVAGCLRRKNLPAVVWGTLLPNAHTPNECSRISAAIADAKVVLAMLLDDCAA